MKKGIKSLLENIRGILVILGVMTIVVGMIIMFFNIHKGYIIAVSGIGLMCILTFIAKAQNNKEGINSHNNENKKEED